MYSSCFNGCGGSGAYIYKLNRITMQFEFYLNIQTTLWQETVTPDISDIAFDHENLIYISLDNGKIYRSSTPSGGTWTNIMTAALSATSSQTNIGIGKDANNNKIIYAINLKQFGGFTNNINWIRKSVNGGASWTNLSIPTLNSVQMRAVYNALIYVNPSDINQVAILGEEFVSTSNGGSTWKFANEDFINNKSIAKKPNSNYLITATENKIVQITNAFNSGNIISEPRIKDLNTSSIWELGFRNNYNDSIFYGLNLLKGKNILEKKGSFYNYLPKSFDNNEPEVSFSFTPSLTYFDNEGNLISKNINPGVFSSHQIDYNEVNNTALGFKFSSEINNQTIFFRVKNIGDGKEVMDNLLVNKSLLNISDVKILNDSVFYVVNHNTNTNLRELFKIKIHHDNSTSYSLQLESNPWITKFQTPHDNSNNLYALIYGKIAISTDEGITWTDKTNSITEAINDYAINPSNPNQVFANSIDKIYVSNNFLSNNVVWEDITGDLSSHIPFMLNKIWYRETDGQLIISNVYRGIFSTNYFQNSVPDSIIIANYTKEACVNDDSVKVSFYKNGAFSETNTYELWISDASGNFTNATKIGTSTNSPIYGIIPDHLVTGTNYKLRVISTNTSVAVKHADTGLFEVKKGSGLFLAGYPKAINATQNGFVINAPVNQNAEVWYEVTQSGKPKPTIDQLISGIDSTGTSFLVADSVIALANASNPIIITGLMSGTNYDAYVAVKLPTEECFSALSKITFSTKGTPFPYCIPQSINGCTGDNYISELRVYNYENYQSSALSNFNSGCEPNAYSFNSQNIEVLTAGINNKVLIPRIHDFEGTFPSRGLAIWIDFNENGDFEDPGELMNSNRVDMNINSNSFYANSTVSPGIKRMRIRLNSGTEYTYPMSPCATYQYGETEDYLVKVETNEPYIFANLDKDTVGQCESIKVAMEITGSYNIGNTFRVELSNATGSFSDSTVLLSGISVNIPVNIQIPRTIPTGHNYRLRVVSTNPVAVSFESAVFSIQPTTQHVITNFTADTHTISQTGSISATNKNSNAARVNFKGWNSVILLPDFEAKPNNSGVFKAEIVGCNN
ncbi:MAG: hypothetical protein IPQ23_11250 [Cytophagaceae bacterium]|nr:hypothetical protein [Cytophagaceae bacterium]